MKFNNLKQIVARQKCYPFTEPILKKQLKFYQKKKSGCMFASICAKNPIKHGWKHFIMTEYEHQKIDTIIAESINNVEIQLVSFVFPAIKTVQELLLLVVTLKKCKNITMEFQKFDKMGCLGFRVSIGKNQSWMLGFGNFAFFKPTRQSPYTELVFRVKQRPAQYNYELPPPTKGAIHIAEMKMESVSHSSFQKYWSNTTKKTFRILGHVPNLHAKAKTTFAIPLSQYSE